MNKTITLLVYFKVLGAVWCWLRDIDDWDLISTLANIILIRESGRDVQHKHAGLRDQEKRHFGDLLSHKKPNDIIVLLDYYITTLKLN